MADQPRLEERVDSGTAKAMGGLGALTGGVGGGYTTYNVLTTAGYAASAYIGGAGAGLALGYLGYKVGKYIGNTISGAVKENNNTKKTSEAANKKKAAEAMKKKTEAAAKK